MLPIFDLWHQLYKRTKEGFFVVKVFPTAMTEDTPSYNVYTPQGEWCGNTRAANPLSIDADIRHIVKWRMAYEREIVC